MPSSLALASFRVSLFHPNRSHPCFCRRRWKMGGQARPSTFAIFSLLNFSDQVILGSVIGYTLDFSFQHLMKFCQRRNLIDRHSCIAQYLSLSILTICVCTLLGSDNLLAAFCCGTAFAWDGSSTKKRRRMCSVVSSTHYSTQPHSSSSGRGYHSKNSRTQASVFGDDDGEIWLLREVCMSLHLELALLRQRKRGRPVLC